jgi:SAM-dependent methyltransferase
MVKAQVATGGRGKAGGVRRAGSPEEAGRAAEAILGLTIKGHRVGRVLVVPASEVTAEYYLSFTLDRGARAFTAMACAEGGMEIEELAATRPGALARRVVDTEHGFGEPDARELAAAAGFPADVTDDVVGVLLGLWETFTEEDALLVEVNPLARDAGGAQWLGLGIEAAGDGGYARALTEREQAAQQEALTDAIARFDVVISTALVPGRPAPVLVTAEAVRWMRPGGVVVDLAAEAGGNCALSVPGEVVTREGVTIAAPLNLPATMPEHASELYARNVLALLELLAQHAAHAADVGHQRDSRDRAARRPGADRERGHRAAQRPAARRGDRLRHDQRGRRVPGHRPDARHVQVARGRPGPRRRGRRERRRRDGAPWLASSTFSTSSRSPCSSPA